MDWEREQNNRSKQQPRREAKNTRKGDEKPAKELSSEITRLLELNERSFQAVSLPGCGREQGRAATRGGTLTTFDARGFYLDMSPWGHVFEITTVEGLARAADHGVT